MEIAPTRIAELSKNQPKEKFTSLYHLLNKEMFLHCHQELCYDRDPGVDKVIKAEYEKNLVENRRSQRRSFNWNTFDKILKIYGMVTPRITEKNND